MWTYDFPGPAKRGVYRKLNVTSIYKGGNRGWIGSKKCATLSGVGVNSSQ